MLNHELTDIGVHFLRVEWYVNKEYQAVVREVSRFMRRRHTQKYFTPEWGYTFLIDGGDGGLMALHELAVLELALVELVDELESALVLGFFY